MVDVTVLVCSCDEYSGTWKPFCHGFRKYWPDCPWLMQLMTNFQEPPCGRGLQVGREAGKVDWTHDAREALHGINSDVVMILFGDYWLTTQPDTQAISEFAQYVADGLAEYIVLFFNRRKDELATFKSDSRLFVIDESDRYRASLQPSLWQREVLLDLLEDGESLWNFEIRGSRRSWKYDNFLSVTESRYLSYVSIPDPDYDGGAVVKGRWMPPAKLYAEREGLKIDFSTNPDGTECEL